jgi:hypothetical protein
MARLQNSAPLSTVIASGRERIFKVMEQRTGLVGQSSESILCLAKLVIL